MLFLLLAMLLTACAGTPEVPEPEQEYWGHADLVIRAFIPPMILAGEGDTIYLSDLIENTGTNVTVATTVRYFITHESPVDVANAVVIGERPLRELGPKETDESMEKPFVIPVGAGQPPLFLAACVDPDNLVEELHDNDNCTTSGARHLQFDSGAVMPADPARQF